MPLSEKTIRKGTKERRNKRQTQKFGQLQMLFTPAFPTSIPPPPPQYTHTMRKNDPEDEDTRRGGGRERESEEDSLIWWRERGREGERDWGVL